MSLGAWHDHCPVNDAVLMSTYWRCRSFEELGKALGKSPSSCRRWMKKRGYRIRPSGGNNNKNRKDRCSVSTDMLHNILADYSIRATSRLFGVAQNTVLKWVRNRDIVNPRACSYRSEPIDVRPQQAVAAKRLGMSVSEFKKWAKERQDERKKEK